MTTPTTQSADLPMHLNGLTSAHKNATEAGDKPRGRMWEKAKKITTARIKGASPVDKQAKTEAKSLSAYV